MAYGLPINIKDVTPPETVEVILHHNYPLKYTRSANGNHSWVITQNTTSTGSQDVTHIVGRLSSIDTDNKKIHMYGGPQAGAGMSLSLVGRGINEEASAEIPWNYIVQLWLLKQVEVPIISEKYGRLTTQRVRVVF
jgi:hypothetical protein